MQGHRRRRGVGAGEVWWHNQEAPLCVPLSAPAAPDRFPDLAFFDVVASDANTESIICARVVRKGAVGLRVIAPGRQSHTPHPTCPQPRANDSSCKRATAHHPPLGPHICPRPPADTHQHGTSRKSTIRHRTRRHARTHQRGPGSGYCGEGRTMFGSNSPPVPQGCEPNRGGGVCLSARPLPGGFMTPCAHTVCY
jgi:hypothetical protein